METKVKHKEDVQAVYSIRQGYSYSGYIVS